MAVWPTGLPAPQTDSLVLTFGDNLLKRTTQSGKVVRTRFGSGAPDKLSVKLRFNSENYTIFNTFYERDLNFGNNWFSSLWLGKLGYSNHKAKIQGYPVVTVKHLYYTELSVEMLIKPAAKCPVDIFWPTN